MDMLKRRLFLIVCALVAAGSVALGVVGLNSMSAVTDELGKVTRLATDLQNESRKPVNDEFIKAEQKRIERITAQHEAVLAWAQERNRAEPLVPEVFPDPSPDQKLAFREAYAARLNELLVLLHAGTVASAQDEADAAEQIREEQNLESRFSMNLGPTDATGEGAEQEQERPTAYPSGLLTDYGARRKAVARANIAKAHRVRCYADLRSLEVFSKIENPGQGQYYPDVLDMWEAQVSLWIQEGVISSLARVNDQAVRALEEKGESAWVGVMPIKALISIRTSPYIKEDYAPQKRPDIFDWNAVVPPEAADSVFTHSVSNELFEVVQFTINIVADARAIPAIIDEICQDNFHTLLQIVYDDTSKDPRTWAMDGQIYGSDPTIKVVMDFETFFFGDIYRDWMPDWFREDLGLPEREEEEEE
jgi:hypothetical protein